MIIFLFFLFHTIIIQKNVALLFKQIFAFKSEALLIIIKST